MWKEDCRWNPTWNKLETFSLKKKTVDYRIWTRAQLGYQYHTMISLLLENCFSNIYCIIFLAHTIVLTIQRFKMFLRRLWEPRVSFDTHCCYASGYLNMCPAWLPLDTAKLTPPPINPRLFLTYKDLRLPRHLSGLLRPLSTNKIASADKTNVLQLRPLSILLLINVSLQNNNDSLSEHMFSLIVYCIVDANSLVRKRNK